MLGLLRLLDPDLSRGELIGKPYLRLTCQRHAELLLIHKRRWHYGYRGICCMFELRFITIYPSPILITDLPDFLIRHCIPIPDLLHISIHHRISIRSTDSLHLLPRYGVSRVYHQQCGYTLLDAQAMHDKMFSMLKMLPGGGLDPQAGKTKYLPHFLIEP